MDFYFNPADSLEIFDDIDFEQEIELLNKQERSVFSNISLDKFDDFEIDHETDIDSVIKRNDLELCSYDSVTDYAAKLGSNNRQDIWNGKHAWEINNSQILHNSSCDFDFIGGSPESALMVNPNVVIPNGRVCYNENVENSYNTPRVTVSKELSLATNKNTVTSIITIPNENRNSVETCKASVVSMERYTKEFSQFESSLQQTKFPKIRCVSKNRIIPIKTSVNRSKCRSPVSVTVQKSDINVNFVKENISLSPSSKKVENNTDSTNNVYDIYLRHQFLFPKPAFSYACLIAMALKNSKDGCLPVSEIYNFMCNHFPYFKSAPNGWKNSVRHNLSLNKCFEKIEKPPGRAHRKGCLWALNPTKVDKLDDEVAKWTRKDRAGIKRAMMNPDHLELLEKGELKTLYDIRGKDGEDEDNDDDFDEENDTESSEIEEPCLVKKETIELPLTNVSNKIDSQNFKVNDNLHDIGNTQNNLFVLETVPSVIPTSSNTSFILKNGITNDMIKQVSRNVNNGVILNVSNTCVQIDNCKFNNSNNGGTNGNFLMQSSDGEYDSSEDEDFDRYDINQLLRFQNISTKGQHYSAKYITANNKSFKSIKQKLSSRR